MSTSLRKALRSDIEEIHFTLNECALDLGRGFALDAGASQHLVTFLKPEKTAPNPMICTMA